MARITVEDCLEKIPNRFQLVLAATYRARMLSQGHTPKIESKNKHGVTALREIAKATAQLSNDNFVSRAKPEVVEQMRTRLAGFIETVARMKAQRDQLVG